MKYFEHNGLLYHCDNIFNYKATDRDGSLYLFQKKPNMRLEFKCNNLSYGGYWGAGYNGNYAARVYLEHQNPCKNWMNSLKILL